MFLAELCLSSVMTSPPVLVLVVLLSSGWPLPSPAGGAVPRKSLDHHQQEQLEQHHQHRQQSEDDYGDLISGSERYVML